MKSGESCLLTDSSSGVVEQIAFIMLLFKYSIPASKSSLVLNGTEVDLEMFKASRKH